MEDRDKSDSESNFGKNIDRSEDWSEEPSRKSGSSGMEGSKSDKVSEALGPERELDESSNLGEQSDVSPSRSGRGGGWSEEH